jgi:mRNA interferase MazF
MNRGDIYWVNLDPSQGAEIRKTRPCVIVSANPLNRVRQTVVVVPLSTAGKPRPPIVIPVQCLGQPVVAVCDQLRAVDKSRLVKLEGYLSRQDLEAIDEGLTEVLSLG